MNRPLLTLARARRLETGPLMRCTFEETVEILFEAAGMCVCVYTCMHICMYACTHACMHVCMYVCMYVCTYYDRVYNDYMYNDTVYNDRVASLQSAYDGDGL